jgi:glutathione S-transferase
VTLFHANAEWSAAAAPVFREGVMRRLTRLSDWLGDKEWLEDRFTVGDLMMVATLRSLSSETLAEASESLAAYVARGEARPAFQRALAAQLGDFVADPV